MPADAQLDGAVRPRSLDITLQAVAASAAMLRNALARFLSDVGCVDGPADNVRLAVGEAIANAVQHAYDETPEPGPVTLRARTSGNRLVVEVADAGSWRRPPPVPRSLLAETGRGLPLMNSLSDRVEVRHGKAGTAVRLTFADFRGARARL